MNKKILLSCILMALVSGGLSACAPNISPDTVQASDAGEIQTAVEGVIVSKRGVTVKGDNTLGTLAGAGLGGIAGSMVGGNDTMHLLMGVTGALAGGAAGNAISNKMTTQQGIEYMIRLAKQDSGTTTINRQGFRAQTVTISSQSAANRYVSVIQSQGAQELMVGQHVLVAGIGGSHPHIISVLQS